MKVLRSVFIAVLIAQATAANAVEISPSTLRIGSRAQEEMLRITENGQPVPAAEIGSVQFLVGDRSYGHMIDVERSEGGLLVRPTSELEIGTYELLITVGDTRVSSRVVATLDEEPGSIQNRASARGVRAEELGRQMGLSNTERPTVQIRLPEWYPVGRLIRIEMAAPRSSNYEWRVNGEIVQSGLGSSVLEYTLRRAGKYRIEFIERKPDGLELRTEAVTQAREPKPRIIRLEGDTKVRLLGLKGYQSYLWLVNGDPVAEGAELVREFGAGDYFVECVASRPVVPRPVTFEKSAFHVVVRPRY